MATILYIDADSNSRTLIERILVYAGHHVLTASRALEGIEIAKQRQPDLVLTDLNLPDFSGHEVASQLRAVPALAAVPIVALTEQNQIINKSLVTGVIAKPVDVVTLAVKVQSYLGGHRDSANPADQATEQMYRRELVERLETNVRDLEATNRELRRLDQIKDDFIQLTAHELRTPLTTVYGYSRLVQSLVPVQYLMAENPEVRVCLAGLMESIERLHAVVSEIVTVSRIASGRIDLKLGPTSITEVVEIVVSGYTNVLQQRGLNLVYDSSTWPPQFYADMGLLELAISNLLSNAVKYTPDTGTITIDVRLEGDRMRISVKDTGIGIDLVDQQHIFDRFYTAGDTQLHSTSKTAFRGGGLGLGLAICRGIVEAHGGKIWVESEGCDEQRLPGSTFFIDLPFNYQLVSRPVVTPAPGTS